MTEPIPEPTEGRMRLGDRALPPRLGSRFRWLLATSWTSNLGDGIMMATGPLLLASLTDQPFLIALGTTIQMIAFMTFGLYAGVVADRFDRRRIMVIGNTVRAGLLLVLAATIVTGRIDVVVALAALFLLGLAETFVDSTATTLLPMVIDRDDLGVGNARMAFGQTTLNRMIGPPLGGLLFAAGMVWPILSTGMLMAAAAVLVVRIGTARPLAQPTGQTVSADIREGVRWLLDHRALRTLALTIVAFNITFGASWSLLVLLASERLGLTGAGFGLLLSATAVGSVVGTVAYGSTERRIGVATIMRVGLVIEAITHLVLATTTRPVVAFAILIALGVHESMWGITSRTIRQRVVPTELQGRVGSVYAVGLVASFAVGAALGGVIAGVWGATGPFWFGFVGSALTVAAIWTRLDAIADAH